ncbi:MAG: M28 family peptidase [Bacteroidales bacterium]|nr:M28 family peptidase [Bacteroidales bacterium]
MKRNFLLIVFTCFAIFASAGNLIKLNVKDPSLVKKHLATQDLRVNYSCNEFLVATTSSGSAENSVLLKGNAWGPGDNYFVLWTKAELKAGYLAKIGPFITILDQTDHYLIVQVRNENVTRLFPSVHGGVVKINNTAIRMPVQPSMKLSAPKEIDPFITELLAQVKNDSIQNSNQHLQNYGTRNCLTPQAIEAQNWIKSRFESYGLPVTLQNFTVNGQNSSANVIATLTGAKYPDQYVILGGHYDSFVYSGNAPGADDNGSGTSSVIEIARILSQYTFDRTIIFIAFSGEEYGLYGSAAYATMAQNLGMNILGYFNTDMCGYLNPGDEIHTDIIAPASAEPLVQFYKDVVQLYMPDFTVDDGQLSGGDSDHTSFNNHGFMGIFPFEDSQNYSPYIHTSQDLIGNSVNSFPMVGTFTQATIANVATMANQLSAPQNLIGTPGDTKITLAWDTLAGMNYFRIYRNGEAAVYDSTTGFSYVDSLLTNGVAYSYYITGIDSASGKETPKSNTITLKPNVPMVLPFTDNFETGAPYWQFEDTWGLSTAAYNSPSHSISESPTGQYGDSKDISTFLGPFSLAACSEASLSFWTKYDLENNYDFMYLMVSTNNQNWTQLAQYTGTQSSWTQKNYSLNDYIGSPNVWVRYRFTSDVNTTKQGMYIDDFVLNVTTTGYTLNGSVVYPNTPHTPLQGITVKLKNASGTVIGTTTTNASGNYSFINIPNGNYSLEAATTKPWGGVTAADILLYKKHIIGIEQLEGIYLAAGDVNASGTLTAIDVMDMQKRIGAIISSFPAGDWLFNAPSFSINGSNLTQNFYGISYGDANGSYIPAVK